MLVSYIFMNLTALYPHPFRVANPISGSTGMINHPLKLCSSTDLFLCLGDASLFVVLLSKDSGNHKRLVGHIVFQAVHPKTYRQLHDLQRL